MKQKIPKDAADIELLRQRVICQPELVIEELFRVLKPKTDRHKEMLAMYGSVACAEIESNQIGSHTPWREIMRTFLIHINQDDITVYEYDVDVMSRAFSGEVIPTGEVPDTNPPALGNLHVALNGGLEFIK